MSDDDEMFGGSSAALPPGLAGAVPNVKPDIQSTAIALRSNEQARALARRIAGGEVPDHGAFWCMGCGFNENGKSKYPKGLTLHFDSDELVALGGDPYAYTGPCPVCSMQMLVPMHALAGDEAFSSVREKASENRKRDIMEATDVVLDKVQERFVGSIFGGGLAAAAEVAEQQAAAEAPKKPGDDLPDANDVDLSNIKPRR